MGTVDRVAARSSHWATPFTAWGYSTHGPSLTARGLTLVAIDSLFVAIGEDIQETFKVRTGRMGNGESDGWGRREQPCPTGQGAPVQTF